MTRRELLKLITIATGSALVGGELLFTACSQDPGGYKSVNFSRADLDLMNDIAETILPRTSTPGAKDAEVGEFMAKIVDNCYFENNQNAFKSGLTTIEELSQNRFGNSFQKLQSDEKTLLLKDLDAKARAYRRPEGGADHYFTLIKQLTIMGFFTSEVGQTKVLRHVPIPGRYEGCLPYEEGDTAWAI